MSAAAAAAGHDGGSLWCGLKGGGGLGGIEVRVSCLVLSCLVDFGREKRGSWLGKVLCLLCSV